MTQFPGIELIQGPRSEVPAARGAGRSRRALVFVTVFVLIAGTGLAWNYFRPAVYRASATVLTVKPRAVDTRSEEADLEHVDDPGAGPDGRSDAREVAAALAEERPGTVLREG